MSKGGEKAGAWKGKKDVGKNASEDGWVNGSGLVFKDAGCEVQEGRDARDDGGDVDGVPGEIGEGDAEGL